MSLRARGLLIGLVCFAGGGRVEGQPRPDAIMVDGACTFVGSAVGKSERPNVGEGTENVYVCWKRKGGGLRCELKALDGSKFLAGGKTTAIQFASVSDTGDRLILMAEGSLVTIIVDRNAGAYVMGQQYVDADEGRIGQKQCVGTYAAGVQVDRLLNSAERQ